jgi:predicted transcriptional regulator
MGITKSQQKIIEAIKQNEWVTVAQIAEITGIAESHVRNAMKTKAFENIRRGKKIQTQPNGTRYIGVYQYPHKDKSHTERALKLAEQHQGIFGQLYWASDLYENIERVA